jgi:hypothetical protein
VRRIIEVAAGLFVGCCAWAQQVTFQGSIRSRVEAWDWFHAPAADNTYAYSGNILRMSVARSAVRWDWQLEFAAPFLLGLPDSAVASGTPGQLGLGAAYFTANQGNRNTGMVFPKQAFSRWKNLGGVTGQSLRAGRFEFAEGAERTPRNATLAALKRDRINSRLIGTFGWTHVGRSFDGVHYALDKPSSTLTLMAAIPTRGVFQTDGWGQTHTAVGYASYSRAWGKGQHAAETRWMGIYYYDWRHVLKTDSRALAARAADLANIRIATLGGHHVSAIGTEAGAVDLMLWGVAQTGRWGTLDHRAHAVAIEGGFQPAGTWTRFWRPWVRAGFFDGSGDANPNDSRHETFFQILPTPRLFDRIPFFNMMNNRDVHAALISRPHARVTVSNEFHSLRLTERNDLWYLGGGAFQPWTFGYVGRNAGGAQSLANLYDLNVDVRLSDLLALNGYFGYVQGLAAPRSVYPGGKDARLGLFEVTYRF